MSKGRWKSTAVYAAIAAVVTVLLLYVGRLLRFASQLKTQTNLRVHSVVSDNGLPVSIVLAVDVQIYNPTGIRQSITYPFVTIFGVRKDTGVREVIGLSTPEKKVISFDQDSVTNTTLYITVPFTAIGKLGTYSRIESETQGRISLFRIPFKVKEEKPLNLPSGLSNLLQR